MNEKGHTLIELVLVLVLLGFLSVTAISQFSGTEDMLLDAAARKTMSDIRYAQSLATSTGSSHGFQALSTTTYKIYKVSTSATVTSPYRGDAMSENFATDFKTTNFSSGSYQVIFDFKGKPTTGGGSTIQLNYGGASRTITVTANTGNVYLN